MGYSSFHVQAWRILCCGSTVFPSLNALAHSTSLLQSIPASYAISSDVPVSTSLPLANLTGNAFCSHVSPPYRRDDYGMASYVAGGKMASVYDAGTDAVFRCNAPVPANGFYVAFWTPFNDDVSASQPQPLNCNQTLVVSNPLTGVTETATVIDRCASCVGVGYQVNDPTTPDCVVNGATVDLSRDLWNRLYDSADGSVYDIAYEDDIYAGWGHSPDPLTELTVTECAC